MFKYADTFLKMEYEKCLKVLCCLIYYLNTCFSEKVINVSKRWRVGDASNFEIDGFYRIYQTNANHAPRMPRTNQFNALYVWFLGGTQMGFCWEMLEKKHYYLSWIV